MLLLGIYLTIGSKERLHPIPEINSLSLAFFQ
jgi:hypothetical protein